METLWTFFMNGDFFNIEKEEGERRVKYDIRVKFISDHISKMPFDDLCRYSKMYANMVLFGVKLQDEHLDTLYNLLNIHNVEIEEANDVNEVAFEDAKFALKGEIISDVSQNGIETFTGTTITPLGERAFIDIPGNEAEELISQPIYEVSLTPSSQDGETQGVVLEVVMEDEIVELKTCLDEKCEEPAPVLVTSPDMGINVIVKPSSIDVTEVETEEVTSEVFGDLKARNAFLMPDMSCYNVTDGEDPETVMEDCMRAKFEKHPELKMKLRATKEKELIFTPEEYNAEFDFWTEDNRYGRILMKIRESMKVTTRFDSADDLSDLTSACQKYIDIPTDDDTMVAYREQVLSDAGLSNGVISEFDNGKLLELFEAYDMEMFEGRLKKLTSTKTLSVILNWNESSDAGTLDVSGDGKVFTLELSKKVFGALPASGAKHVIFGVLCETQMSCVQIYIESFIVTIVYEICHLDKPAEVLGELIFRHSSSDVKFDQPKQTGSGPKVPIRQQLLNAQNADPQADIIITIRDLGRVIMASARNQETVFIRSILEPDNVQVQESQKRQPYANVTHINDVPV